MNTYYWACGSGLVSLELTEEDASIGSHPGPCDADVAYLRTIPRIADQLAEMNPDSLRDTLREYGAWGADELADHDENLSRILWIACGDVSENPESYL